MNQHPVGCKEPNPDNISTQGLLQQLRQVHWQTLTLKQARGGLLLLIGYLLSPLCWWNDLVFNLPVAYGFGYGCSLFAADWFVPGAIVGYWLSNLVGFVLMQFGMVDVLPGQPQARNFKKDLLMSVATSTAYTLVILALVQFKILDLSALIPDLRSIGLSALLPSP